MSTANPSIGPQWALIATAGDEFLLTLLNREQPVEVAVSDTEVTPPGIEGHILSSGSDGGMNRALIGPGYVYARPVQPRGGSVTVALSTWTPS
jgi:hypothetical protein